MPSLRRAAFKLTHKESSLIQYKCVRIYLFDDDKTPIEMELTEGMNGSLLLDNVCASVGGLLEKDYFGLRYVYRKENKRWLDSDYSVLHQLKKAKTTLLSFQVKHYPANPLEDIVQDLAKYFFYLQLRRDLFSGNLLVKGELLFKLISLVIYAEQVDLIEPTEEEVFSIITNLNIVENVNSKMVDEIIKVILTMNGLEAKEAEKKFLVLVSQLESYGAEPYSVTDQTGENLFLAMHHQGICIFVGEKRKQIFYWENISKMMFIKKSFVFDINVDNKKKRLWFKFGSENLAKEFWKWALDRQYFMTLNNSSEAKKVKSNNVIFSRKVTHRFSGRSMKELTISCNTLDSVPQPSIVRIRNQTISRSYSSKAICRHSVNLDDKESKPDSFATLPRRSKANKDSSILSINFKCDDEEKLEQQVTSTTSEESVLTPFQETENQNYDIELPVITEDMTIEEIIDCRESNMEHCVLENLDNNLEENEAESELRNRLPEFDENDIEPKIEEFSDICNDIDVNYRLHNSDGMFFVKFVILTTLILLVVMVTSLIAYYYYRSSTIADLNKQKYSSEWNKNIDLESIKRFVLRNDAP